MDWVRKREGSDGKSEQAWDFLEGERGEEGCSTRKTVRTRCNTEEVEPGKFLRKCHKTEEILRECIGRPVEVVESKDEYTVEDVAATGSSSQGHFVGDGPFTFPGIRRDIEDIERYFSGEFNRFVEAAEEMKSSFFDIFDNIQQGSGTSTSRRRVPIDGAPKHESTNVNDGSRFADIDLSRLGKDV